MEQLQIFNSPQFGDIRVMSDENNNPVFCLLDVARSLGYSNPAKAVIDHCKGVTVLETPTNGGIQNLKYGKESDVYRLVMRSKLPDAEKFQDWVCEYVLPSIRKHGIYVTATTIEQMLSNPDAAIQLLQTLKDERSKRIEAESKNKELQPKAIFADAVATSNKSCLIGELAKILCQNGIDVGQNKLFRWMRNNGYLCSKGESYNQPTQKAMNLSLFEIKKTTITKPDNTLLVTVTTKVTGKGQIYFVNKFLDPQQ